MGSNAGSSAYWLYDNCYVNSLKKLRLKIDLIVIKGNKWGNIYNAV